MDRPGVLSFPTRGPSRYFGGDDMLAERVRSAVTDLGVPAVRVGIADSRFAARQAARVDAVIAPGESALFLAPRSVRVLGDPDFGALLIRLGLPTMGAFAALPASAVHVRFGPDGLRRHRWARGLDDAPSVLAEVPPEMIETHNFDPPCQRVDLATFAAKALADHMLTRLADRGMACTRIVIEAETEHGEHWSRAWRHDGAFTPSALADRARWQLESWLGVGTGTDGRAGRRRACRRRGCHRWTPGVAAPPRGSCDH